jgi:sialate O-acetylesterase
MLPPRMEDSASRASRARDRARAGRRAGWLALACAGLASAAAADVEMPAVFGDHMVVQRGAPIAVFGRADPGEALEVALAGRTASTVAGGDGRWLVHLEALPAGGPHRLTVIGRTKLEFEDVLVGEVWLGSGQSNMHMTVAGCMDCAAEAARSDLPAIRMFREQSFGSDRMDGRGSGWWRVATPASVVDFSGTLFFFGRQLHGELGVPIGLIDSSLGGTPIEAWTSATAQLGSLEVAAFATEQDASYHAFDLASYMPDFWERRERARAEPPVEVDPRNPSQRLINEAERHLRIGNIGHLFNGKIAPLIPYTLRGIVWYQGEANTLQSALYRYQLPLLIEDWRARWGEPGLPFAWVQLPNYGDEREGADWALMREAMRRSLCLPRTGMAIALDLGETAQIHPSNKQEVGKRLAAWALAEVYGLDVEASGPLFLDCVRRGDELVASFEHVRNGLVSREDPLSGFEIAGADGVWREAQARLERDRVVVRSPEVAEPLQLRYAWANDARATLFNGAGYPASPFTTVELWR